MRRNSKQDSNIYSDNGTSSKVNSFPSFAREGEIGAVSRINEPSHNTPKTTLHPLSASAGRLLPIRANSSRSSSDIPFHQTRHKSALTRGGRGLAPLSDDYEIIGRGLASMSDDIKIRSERGLATLPDDVEIRSLKSSLSQMKLEPNLYLTAGSDRMDLSRGM